jgi:hypothetical protein
MTRETKIGLLVGLAFIIVIGILLSDHLTSSTDPPPAAMTGTGNSVREQVRTPGGAQMPVVTTVTPPHVQPQAPVPTPRELQPLTPPASVVQVGVGGPSLSAQGTPQSPTVAIQQQNPGPQPQGPAIVMVRNEDPAPAQPTASQPQQVAGADVPTIVTATAPPPAPVNDNPLARIAQQHGEPLVTMTPTGQQRPLSSGNAAAPTGMKEYVAQSGDNVSRMASNLMGGNTKANRDAIIRANPSLQQDANKVIVGRTYRIPASAGEATPASAVMQTAVVVQQQSQPRPIQQVPASATEYWYTVKEGDSLWKIAADQLGNGNAWASIKELNKDVLNGTDTVTVNMRLRLPSKPIAQAN